ncbi:hypothetical protein UFOVP330_11 [uncultured Caudovirales phage]|uniref:Uncharacterized protein n=1 Tax=uncultured Caudovirales phage TaxID=2100421 RepID=A0A6J5LUU4_9CAUD|nr:hypothetical protein UFOVP330_11 [uncultured Caudovirales phage]
MEYWTVMWITVLSGYLEGATLAIPYETEAQCLEALNAVSDTLPYDHKLDCRVGDVPSSSIRPQPRPEGLGE